MADSDDECDRRRRRDKFRRERSDYQERRNDRSRHDERAERNNRKEYRDYDSQRRRERYSPFSHDVSPPLKRMRRDWDDRGRFPGYDLGYPLHGGTMMAGPPLGGWVGGMPPDMGMMHNQYGFGSHHGPQRDIEKPITQPPMMTFKQFLCSQDDAIDDQEAARKYSEYKLEFKRQQINEFFLNHKEEEWFKSKYHPEECGKRLAEQRTALKKRLDVFMELLQKNYIDGVSVDADKSDQIIRLLDAVVIKLEGGTDFDLKSLDQLSEEEKPKESDSSLATTLEKKSEEEQKVPQEEKEKKSPKSRRTRSYNYDENDDDSSAESEIETEPTIQPNNEAGCVTVEDEGKDLKSEEEDVSGEKERSEQDSAEKDAPLEEKPEIEKAKETKLEIETEEEKKSEKSSEEKLVNGTSEDAASENDNSKEGEVKPRPLHKTKSIFLRNLAPIIAKQEVEAVCKRYPCLLRVAISDPQPERRFFRRGWATFDRTVNIKEICWNLNNIRLRDYELGAIVNRDLSWRVRPVDGITAHKQVVRSDIKLATRMIQNLDEQRNMWEDVGKKLQEQSYGLVSRNPLLRNITDYLIEEASAEEEELLGVPAQEDNKQGEDNSATLERDETLIKVLDRLILYLRIVHSVDYYNSCEYSNEDEMPNRCGIIHARGSPPSSKVTQQEINDYLSQFEQKASAFLQPQVKLSEDEAAILGKKDPIVEVEKFVQANTQELAKDKWLCPLSGKKFKGAEYVRKHIFNKHSVKVEEVRKEVKYFNNYLVDPKRPQLPPHPSNRTNTTPVGSRDEMYPVLPPNYGVNGYPPSTYPSSYGASRGFPGSYGGRSSFVSTHMKRSSYGRHSDPRDIVGYHDLDRPLDME